MTKTVIGDITAIPLSPAIKTDSVVFVSGQVPTDENGKVPEGMATQTRAVLDKIKSLVEAAGSSMDKVVKTTVFITDRAEFGAMNAVYAEYFPSEPPARSTIECKLMIDVKVEIEAVALL